MTESVHLRQRIAELEAMLRPFAEAYNRASSYTSQLDDTVELAFRAQEGDTAFIWTMDLGDFASAADLVPEESK